MWLDLYAPQIQRTIQGKSNDVLKYKLFNLLNPGCGYSFFFPTQ